MKNIFRKFDQYRSNLTPAELQVVNKLSEDPQMFITKDINEIAKETFVSTATVSRTIRKLNFGSLEQFKFFLHHELEQEQKSQQKNINYLSTHSLLPKITIEDFDPVAVNNVINLIKQAHHIEFLGLGPSYAVAVDGARRLMFAGKNSSSRSEWDEIEMVVSSIDVKDLVFLISSSGETKVMKQYASVLKQRQVHTVGIIGHQNSTLEENVEYAFTVCIPETYYKGIDISTRIPLFQLIEIIINEYIFLTL